MVKMTIAGLVKTTQGTIVVLLDEAGRRAVAVGAGRDDASWAIDRGLHRLPARRPTLQGVVIDLLDVAGAVLESVCISGLRDR